MRVAAFSERVDHVPRVGTHNRLAAEGRVGIRADLAAMHALNVGVNLIFKSLVAD